jgi:hypothetical protein
MTENTQIITTLIHHLHNIHLLWAEVTEIVIKSTQLILYIHKYLSLRPFNESPWTFMLIKLAWLASLNMVSFPVLVPLFRALSCLSQLALQIVSMSKEVMWLLSCGQHRLILLINNTEAENNELQHALHKKKKGKKKRKKKRFLWILLHQSDPVIYTYISLQFH